tara:strand:+ start:74 stop:367 length:294 start_codon:yes stop_codon:yes gene_type:complete
MEDLNSLISKSQNQDICFREIKEKQEIKKLNKLRKKAYKRHGIAGASENDLFDGNTTRYFALTYIDCRWAKNVVEENLICFSGDAEAVGDGRTRSEC